VLAGAVVVQARGSACVEQQRPRRQVAHRRVSAARQAVVVAIDARRP
jgi:hypothetical protein